MPARKLSPPISAPRWAAVMELLNAPEVPPGAASPHLEQETRQASWAALRAAAEEWPDGAAALVEIALQLSLGGASTIDLYRVAGLGDRLGPAYGGRLDRALELTNDLEDDPVPARAHP